MKILNVLDEEIVSAKKEIEQHEPTFDEGYLEALERYKEIISEISNNTLDDYLNIAFKQKEHLESGKLDSKGADFVEGYYEAIEFIKDEIQDEIKETK